VLLLDYPQVQYQSGSTYRIKLVATNAPILIEQPQTLTVGSNDGALFSVLACGIRPLSYQWRFNGADLPGAMAPTLALNGVTPGAVGSYCVVVSNETGMTTSESVSLNIAETEIGPVLDTSRLVPSERFQFTLTADAGRYYRIESSTNLLDWSAEKSFAMDFSTPAHDSLTSVTFNSSGSTALSIAKISSRNFVRASHYSPVNQVCNNNLKQIRFAKGLWAIEVHKFSYDTPVNIDIFSWRFNEPHCPQGGMYSLHEVDLPPTCSVADHVLEEPR
jgi:hypothetical protein